MAGDLAETGPPEATSEGLIRLAGPDQLFGMTPRWDAPMRRGACLGKSLLSTLDCIERILRGVVPPHDQRGVLRPQGSEYDIGAVEVEQN